MKQYEPTILEYIWVLMGLAIASYLGYNTALIMWGK